MKIILTTVLLWISSLSMGQNYTNDHHSTDITKNEVSQKHPNTDKPVNTKKDHNLISESNNTLSDTEKEWRKIKKEIRKNKRKFSSRKNTIYTTIIVDTIYVDTPLLNSKSQLSEW